MGKPTEPHLIDLKIISHKFVMVPAAWLQLMQEHGKGIPASFWTCLLVVWADIVGQGRYKLEAKKTVRQLPLRRATACKWTAALSVSGLFYVRYGFRHSIDQPGNPTVFVYHDAAPQEWIAFIEALAEHQKAKFVFNDTTLDGYRAALAYRVNQARARYGLPAVNQEYLAWYERKVLASR